MRKLLLLCVCLVLGFFIAQAQDNPGFISIDCGAATSYRDPKLSIYYTTDTGFVESGQNKLVSSNSNVTKLQMQQLMNLRAFPTGKRNCYTIRTAAGTKNRYLIRASFAYGNYDGTSQPPTFDLYIDVNYWTTVDTQQDYVHEEIIYNSARDYIQVCLVNRGTGTPFISALELRLLDISTYDGSFGAARVPWRFNIGSSDQYRYPQDVYDRIWEGHKFGYPIITNTNQTVVDSLKANNNAYSVPAEVLTTQESEKKGGTIFWSNSNNFTWYVYLHFAEIQVLLPTDKRQFTVYVNDYDILVKTITPEYLSPLTVPSLLFTGTVVNFTLSPASQSNMPAILNAVEFLQVIDLPNSATDLNDVHAIMDIKSTYQVIKETWQGDPCVPSDLIWIGLSCTKDNSPTIMSLNLSSSGLKGNISTSFHDLAALVVLDLSFNQLTGQLPEFFAQMPNLKFLNLSGNSLSGPIPDVLRKKMSDGTLNLILDGNPLYPPGPYNPSPANPSPTPSKPKKKNNILLIVIAVVGSFLVLVLLSILAITFYRRRKNRRLQGVNGARPVEISRSSYEVSKSLETSIGSKEGIQGIGKITRAFSSSEVSSITENFKVIIGEGGFGNVFLGTLFDGTKVAVKVLSPESKQGVKEFQAEAQLLMIVHHKNLVSLLGYCDEFENMALIYELMPHGNLRQHLSEYSVNILRWDQRLQIAVDAAQGLEYLHNGCKPPIIHRDLKTSNILLDENMHAKIADFGLSRIFKPEYHESYVSTRPAGTPGYLDPMFHSTGNLNKKSDIYSLGIILFELITGHPAIIRSPKSSIHIIQWVTPPIERGDLQSVVDPRILGRFNANSVWKVIETAMHCVHLAAAQRPDINQVLSELKASLAIEIDSRGNYSHNSTFETTSVEFNLAPVAR